MEGRFRVLALSATPGNDLKVIIIEREENCGILGSTLYVKFSIVHFELAIFVHHIMYMYILCSIRHFCTSYRRMCVLCSIWHFLHMIHTIKCTFCAQNGTLQPQVYILSSPPVPST